jgi:DNA-binding MarR family transcriptional regulator
VTAMRCYCAGARRVARQLTRLYEAELRPAGMNPAQFELMANLQGRPGANQVELAAAMDVDQTTLSRNLKVLMQRGWVVASASKKDARRAEYRLSAEGRRALGRAVLCWEQAMERVNAGLGKKAGGVWGVLDGLSGAAI